MDGHLCKALRGRCAYECVANMLVWERVSCMSGVTSQQRVYTAKDLKQLTPTASRYNSLESDWSLLIHGPKHSLPTVSSTAGPWVLTGLFAAHPEPVLAMHLQCLAVS